MRNRLLVGAATGSLFTSVYRNRPRNPRTEGTHENGEIFDPSETPQAMHWNFCRLHAHPSNNSYYVDYTARDSVFLKLARRATVASVGTLCRVWMHWLNTTHTEGQDNLLRAMASKQPTQGLITVSNHTSVVDDPAILASIVPASWCFLGGIHARWGTCTEEHCFKNRLLSAFFGAGQILPIRRGAGLEQDFLRVVFRKVQEGRWMHFFPEGKTEAHTQQLGGRSEPRAVKEKGLLKWGVGKVIAHAVPTPVVVPFYHEGMQNIMPQDKTTNKCKFAIPRTGNKVFVHIGAPICFDDILIKYRVPRAKARSALEHARQRGATGEDAAITPRPMLLAQSDPFESTEVDKACYHEIMLRIERHLIQLEHLVMADYKRGLGVGGGEQTTSTNSGGSSALVSNTRTNTDGV